MEAIRVCHVIHNTQVGGTEMMLLRVLRHLHNRRDVHASVISLMGHGPIAERIEALGVPVFAAHCVEAGVPRPDRLYRVIREMRRFQPHIVQTWSYHADLVGGLAARLFTRARIVWNIRHSTLDPELDSRSVLRSAWLSAGLSGIPDRILVNSHAAVGVHQRAGYPVEKMEIVPNGFDLERFQPCASARDQIRRELGIPDASLLVGMAGRYHPHKGQEEFLSAANRLRADNPNLHFLIAGTGCDQQNTGLAKLVQRHQLGGSVHLLGLRNDMARILNALDVFVLPSLTEGMPNALGEAMACGICCVATDVGDAGRMLNDDERIVKPGQPAALAATVQQALDLSQQQRTALGAQNRERTMQYDIRHVAQRYESVWREVAGGASTANVLGQTAVPGGANSLSVPRSGHAAPLPRRPKLVHVTTIAMTPWLFLRGQNAFMHEQGFDVHVVSSADEFQRRLAKRDPVTVHEVPISRRIDPIRDWAAIWRLCQLFRQLRPEIVQLSTPKAALLGAIAARVAGVPIRIYQVRGLSSESERGIKRRLFQLAEGLTARLCNACLVNAKSLLEYGRAAGILRVGIVANSGMSNGVDLQRFDPDRVSPAVVTAEGGHDGEGSGPIVGFVGRLTRDKGVEDLYAAWSQIRDEIPSARLLLVGPWESEAAVCGACRAAMQADPSVILAGPQDRVEEFYRMMDLFVFPSHGTEGFPNAPMEAAAMGLPVIATNVVGCVDAVQHDVTGTLVPPRSPEALARAIRCYLLDGDLRTQHGAAGRARVCGRFVPQDLWVQFGEYYLHLLRRERLPLPTQRQSGRRAA